MRKLKWWRSKFYWWLAFKLPKQLVLYAFVRVHSLSGEGPNYKGEYRKAYDLWCDKYGITD